MTNNTAPRIRDGRQEGVPYSLSRWTDVVGGKWAWFQEQLHAGHMYGFHPSTGVPVRWSLLPQETLGLIFWTRAPANMLKDAHLLAPYRVKVHMTVTGWHEVERGAPNLEEGSWMLRELVKEFGANDVTWRFSPIPMVQDVEERFTQILDVAHSVRLKSVFMSFLQPNDRMPEIRTPEERRQLLQRLAAKAADKGVQVKLCNEDRLLADQPAYPNLGSGVCAPPEDFELSGLGKPASEGCGCVLMADPFSINEACSFSCSYCYVSDNNTAKNKRNTTNLKRKLPQLVETK